MSVPLFWVRVRSPAVAAVPSPVTRSSPLLVTVASLSCQSPVSTPRGRRRRRSRSPTSRSSCAASRSGPVRLVALSKRRTLSGTLEVVRVLRQRLAAVCGDQEQVLEADAADALDALDAGLD